MSLAPNSNSILLSHILRTLNQNGLGFRTRRTQIAEIQFFSILLFWILFSASLVLIISLILLMTHLIHLLQLKLLNFYLSNKFILSFFFVHLQFESIQTEKKIENSLVTPCHFIVAPFQQKRLLPYAAGGDSALAISSTQGTQLYLARAVALQDSILSDLWSNKDRARAIAQVRLGGGAAPPHTLFSFYSI